MQKYLIPKDVSKSVIMTGVYYKNNHPGGISAVIQYWSEFIEGIQYYPTFKESSNYYKILLFAWSYIHLFVSFLINKDIKIVHIHTAAGTDFRRNALIINLSRLFDKKIVLHSHASQFVTFYDNNSERKKHWIVKTIKKADRLIVLSESWKRWFLSIGIDEDKIVILHNITSYPSLKRKNICIRQAPIHFLFLGEIGHRKGVFDLIQTLADNKVELEGRLILRIGGNKEEEKLISLIKTHGLENMIEFLGFVSGDRKIEMLNWADVFILPSYNEGLPISILEAMSYKMPVISTPVGGIPEVVDNTNGIIVNPGNKRDIYNAIKFYIDHPNIIDTQGEKSFEKVQSYFPEEVMKSLRNIYESLVN